MGLYFGETELTGLYFGDIELTGLYFGDIEIWGAWAEYDGALPAQYSADGSYLADYRVYGASGGVGDMTANLFDPNAADVEKNCYYNDSGVKVTNHLHSESGFIPVSPGEYTFSFTRSAGGSTFFVNFYDANKNFVSNMASLAGSTLRVSVTIQDYGYVRFNFAKYFISNVMFRRGGVASYVPYGYVIPISVSDGTTSTTTPIYIGSDSLGEDEYADYKAGKIYRTTKNIMPSAAAGSATDHGVTVTCDGNSTYQISGRANGNAVIRFDLREFTIPAALDNGGNGVIALSYPRDPDVTIYLLDGNNAVYTINPYYGNVYTDYGVGLTIDGIAFAIADGQYADEFPFIIMITNDGTVPSVIDDYVPHLTPTNPPVALPALPTRNALTITDYAGKRNTDSANIMPSATAQTQTSGVLSVTCDGEGRYHINKTGNGDLYVYFDVPEFTIPISKQGGGNGTVSFFNTMNSSAMVLFMNGSSNVDSWQMNSTNRQTDGYGSMAGKVCNRIGFNCWGGSWTGDINIMFTDNGILPSAFEPPSHALPRPSRFYAKYKRG